MMQLEEFIKKFAECFNQTDAASITPETEFRKLDEWGSMMALIVIAMVDADYNKTVTSEDLKSANTVAQLFDVINRN